MRSVAQLLLMLALAVTLPAMLCRKLDFPDNLAGDAATNGLDTAKQIAKLQENSTDWVLVGNSMLNTRLDSAPLEGLSGSKVNKIAKGGTQSAVWFLIFKNVILKSEVQPQLVTIFFRDLDLTWADFRVKGFNERFITDLDGPAQPEFQQVLGARESEEGLPGRLTGTLKQIFPASDLRPMARRQMQERAFRATGIGIKANSSVRRAELNERFSLAHLRHDLGLDFAASGGGTSAAVIKVDGEVIDPGFYEDGPAVFDPSPDASFLPHLIALAKTNGIQLHFHRIKRRPARNHTRPDNPQLATYISDLGRYLKAEGCLFTDESADVRLTLEMYVDGDHISSKESMQARYLENFWERVGPIVQPILQNTRSEAEADCCRSIRLIPPK